MKILSVGWFDKISNTSLHRHNAIEKNYQNVDVVDCSADTTTYYRVVNKLFNFGLPIKLPDSSSANSKIVNLVTNNQYDLVWIDKGITINKKTLLFIKKVNPQAKIVSFSPDNMALRHNQSENYLGCISLYDFHITTKSSFVEAMYELGAPQVIFVNKTFNSEFHYPRKLSKSEVDRLGADIGFIGMWEQERCESILFLVDNGLRVTVFGDGEWNNYKNYSPNLTIAPSVYSDDYPKALSAFKISLCFLRKINFDKQTARTMEIPACGGFMLAERTDEHLALFEEGKEAEFFSSDEELLEKCRYYLNNEEERKAIVERGILRCKNSGYSNIETMKKLIDAIIKT